MISMPSLRQVLVSALALHHAVGLNIPRGGGGAGAVDFGMQGSGQDAGAVMTGGAGGLDGNQAGQEPDSEIQDNQTQDGGNHEKDHVEQDDADAISTATAGDSVAATDSATGATETEEADAVNEDDAENDVENDVADDSQDDGQDDGQDNPKDTTGCNAGAPIEGNVYDNAQNITQGGAQNSTQNNIGNAQNDTQSGAQEIDQENNNTQDDVMGNVEYNAQDDDAQDETENKTQDSTAGNDAEDAGDGADGGNGNFISDIASRIGILKRRGVLTNRAV